MEKSTPPRIPTNRPYFTERECRTIGRETEHILRTGVLTMGPWVERLERAAAHELGVPHVVATNSGTGALEILLRYFDVAGGDEVIVPVNTFVATANAVTIAGGAPVLADIRADTLSLDPEAVASKVSSRTKGVITVHIAGIISPDFEVLRDLCRERGLFLIEDAAHAFGARAPAGNAGRLADGAAFSLFPTKPVTAGEGGLLATADKNCAAFAHSFRCHGIDAAASRHRFVRLGHNFRMSEITALVGHTSVQGYAEAQALRDTVARYYIDAFEPTACRVPAMVDGARNAWFKFPLILPRGLDGKRVRERCAQEGVMCNTCYWPPVHRQPYYARRPHADPALFPAAEEVLARTIALPMFPELPRKDAERVVEVVLSAVSKETSI